MKSRQEIISVLDKGRREADLIADELIHIIFKSGKQSAFYASLFSGAIPLDNDLKKIQASERAKPKWYDAARLVAGQEVFRLYASEIMMLLGLMALPYCYAASPGNMALYLSEKMRHTPAKRLFDTANFVIGVSTPGSFEENGLAQREINKTRLIHALARYYLLKSDWQMDWGLPINQEDMAGTNLAFSYITLMGLRKSGFTLTAKQEEDFIYLWRYIGYQLYIEEILLPDSLHSAFHLTKIIEERNFKPNEEGVLLSRSLIDYYRNAIPDKQVANLMEAQLSFYLGEKVADFLKIKSDPLAMNIIKLRMSLQAWQNYFKVQVPTYQQMLLNQEQFEKAIKHETSSRSHT